MTFKLILRTLSTGSLHSYRTVLTGACGFLGRHLTHRLLSEGAEVVAIDQSPTIHSLGNQSPFSARLRTIQLELEEPLDEVTTGRFQNGASFCIHLAGLSHVSQCNADPLRAYRANVTTTAILLDFCRRTGINTFLFPSSGLVYGTSLAHPAKEKDPKTPLDMYTATKLASETLIQGYQATSGIKGIIVRLANVYGPGMSEETVIGTMLCQARAKKRPSLRDLSEVRDFIYVDDVVEAMIRLATAAPEASLVCVNVSTGAGISIRQAAETLTRIAGLPPLEVSQTWESSPSSLILDNTELVTRTSWRPQYTLSDGLRRMWETRDPA